MSARRFLAWARSGWHRVVRPRAAATPIAALATLLDGLPGLLFETAGVGLLAVDAQGGIVRSNATLQQMVGPAVDLRPGAAAAGLFAAAERAGAWEEVRQALLGRPARPARSVRLADSVSGVDAMVLLQCASLLGRAQGELPIGALLRFVDVTPQRQLEAQLAHAQKLQAVGQLAGGIAHDFNNLLTAILGAADAIAERPAADSDSREDATQIRASAVRGAALVRQLLAFGRQQTLQPKAVQLNVAIGELAAMLRRLLGSTVHLALELEDTDLRVRVDPSQLDQVLMNLVVNARDAMPGGGTLTLRSGTMTLYRPLERGIETVPPGRYAMVEVVDTGCGIPPDVLQRIFDPFFSTKRERGGSGLGLSTVHGIVRQSEGFVAVESELGRGTRMRVYLPRWDGTEAVAIPPPPVATPAQDGAAEHGEPSGRTVLLVEDEAPVRRLAERALTRHGWVVLAADCAETALAVLAQRHPAAAPITAIITDLVMPGLGGAALVAEVRALLHSPDLPAVLVSGYAEATAAAELRQSGSVRFLQKPYEMNQLAAELAELC